MAGDLESSYLSHERRSTGWIDGLPLCFGRRVEKIDEFYKTTEAVAFQNTEELIERHWEKL